MMFHRRIGSADVYNIVEYIGPTHDPARVFADLTREQLSAAITQLGPHQYSALIDRFVIAVQIWVVRWKDNVIVIDTGVGNFKTRPVERINRLNTRVLEWFDAAGGSRDSVTHVFNTHLHADHVGWNTVEEAEAFVPTFRRAKYFLPKLDFDNVNKLYVTDKSAGVGSFADSVLPVVDAGQVELVQGDEEIAGLKLTRAPGHSPGMFRLTLESDGETGVFCADIFHSPIQIIQPHVNTSFCMIPQQARETRLAFVEEMANTSAIIMPCHFGFPHAARVTRKSEGFGFEPVPVT